MKDHVVLLTERRSADVLAALARETNPSAKVDVVDSYDDLSRASEKLGARPLLLSYGTGVIVSRAILERFQGSAVNFHGASPNYPGRDPHHFASYDGVRRYGATAHVMEPKVDAGRIIGVEEVDVMGKASPSELLRIANDGALRLMKRLIPSLMHEEPLPRLEIAWGPRKTTRRDFLKLCSIPAYAGMEELERRIRATDAEGYRNLCVDLHGWRFRFEGPSIPDDSSTSNWDEFTEARYCELLDLAAARYRFAAFDAPGDGRHVLWRHDIDLSVHRAARLAEFEQVRQLSATYCFMLHSAFYDLYDPDVIARARAIVSMGHRAGLHFSAEAYPDEQWTRDALERRVIAERVQLTQMLGCEVNVVSFHNPDASRLRLPDNDLIGGMVNTYGRGFRDGYGYCSDSNGYWRYDPLADVLSAERHARLQVLTHPEWWTPQPMSPRRRVERCVLGRAAAVMRTYDAGLAAAGRKNIGGY